MDTIQKGIITLIKSAVTQQPLSLPEGFSMAEACPQILRHSLTTLCYDGAVRCGIPKTEPVMHQLFVGYCKALQTSEGQLRQIGKICKAFDENGIDYMPLKGSNMKHLYPAPELRTMGDADILIRVGQYEKIAPLVHSMGYRPVVESDHELIWKHPALYLELHKRVIPSYNKDFYAYFGDGWKLATIREGSRYRMRPEDEFIYELTHFAKHFRDGGIGLRHVTDLWLYVRKNPGLDWGYLNAELDKLSLRSFYDNIRRLIQMWFDDAPSDVMTDFLTAYIFDSGNWGLSEEHFLSGLLRREKDNPRETHRLGFVLSRLFPDVKSLSQKYTVLKKAPWLLPVVWVVRPFYKLLFERGSLKRELEKAKLVTEEKIDGKRQMLRTVGLDFNF